MRDVLSGTYDVAGHFDRNAIEQLKSYFDTGVQFRRQRRSMLTQLRLSSSLGQGYLKNYRN